MLSVKNISKSYGVETLFDSVNFNLNPGERLAMIGPNGCGKSTLMSILAGLEKPDGGSILLSPPNQTIGFLPQGGFSAPADDSIDAPQEAGLTMTQFLSPVGRDQTTLEMELERQAVEISRHPEQKAVQDAYNAALEELQAAAETTGRLPGILSALGLDHLPGDFPVASLSGGQQTRLALVRILLQQPDVLLLDEPTNHLDLEMLKWLEIWLVSSPRAVLFVSHDRRFLEKAATGILEFDVNQRRIRCHAVGYRDYLAIKSSEKEEQLRAYNDQQSEIARLKTAARHLRATATFSKGGKSDTNDKFAKGFFANRSLGTVSRAKNIENKINKIKQDNPVERPRRELGLKIEFQESTGRSREVLALKDLSVGYGEKVLLSGINQLLVFGSRAALIGPNGSGKSTLLRTIAGELTPLAGEVKLGASVKLGVLSQIPRASVENGNPLTEIQFVSNYNETEARAFLSYYLFQGDAVFTPLSALSYGEQSRLSLARLVAGGCNFLLLDEPLNHLDISSRQHMEEAVLSLPGTVLFVVHDRAFIERVATETWEIRDGMVNKTA
ncbi:MAG: ribosomal protection-like ABC-F family protein [Anaerolineaceae bacterium]